MKYVIIGIIAILLASSIFILLNPFKSGQFIASPVPKNNKTSISPAEKEELTIYADPAGFTFKYPKGVNINKVGVVNDQIYASLELSLPNKPETISMKIESSNFDSIDEWFKGNKKSSIYGDINKGKLADIETREFESNNLKTMIALDQGALITISTNAKTTHPLYAAYKKIISTFAFVQPTQTLQQNSSEDSSDSNQDIIDEGEEIVE